LLKDVAPGALKAKASKKKCLKKRIWKSRVCYLANQMCVARLPENLLSSKLMCFVKNQWTKNLKMLNQ